MLPTLRTAPEAAVHKLKYRNDGRKFGAEPIFNKNVAALSAKNVLLNVRIVPRNPTLYLHEISHRNKRCNSIDVEKQSNLSNGKGAEDGIDWLITVFRPPAED